jgi:hypothetical protein
MHPELSLAWYGLDVQENMCDAKAGKRKHAKTCLAIVVRKTMNRVAALTCERYEINILSRCLTSFTRYNTLARLGCLSY